MPIQLEGGGLLAGYDALQQLIAARKFDEIKAEEIARARHQFAEQTRLDEAQLAQQAENANLNRLLRSDTLAATEENRKRADEDRNAAIYRNRIESTPIGTKLSAEQFVEAQKYGFGGLAKADPIVDNSPQTWTWGGTADAQEALANRKSREEAAVQAANDRKALQEDRQQHTMTMANVIAGLQANKPLTAYQRAQEEHRVGNEYRKETAGYKEMVINLGNMESAFQRAQAGQRVGSDESIIVNFERALDPKSVVREGEYARVGGGSPILDRMLALVQQVRAGGGPLTVDGLRQLVDLSRQFTENQKIYADAARTRATLFADEYKLDPRRVMGEEIALPPRTQTPAAGAGITVTSIRPKG
jgi:hypothetical protein